MASDCNLLVSKALIFRQNSVIPWDLLSDPEL